MNEDYHNDLRRDFADRDDLITWVREQFPQASAPEYVSVVQGGRKSADSRLHTLDLTPYDRTRNHLDGAVTRLSPWVRHGVISLAELRDLARSQEAPARFINELAWRDYYQRVYARIGDGIWEDREPYKTGFSAAEYADILPEEICAGTTGTCMDPFCRELVETGWLHNHARMWLAAYIIHWRRVKWQAGARWFLEHLLDGDPASNNLSWQWVASTFSHKPYIFNRDNLRRFGALCDCQTDSCPFAGSYATLERRLFPHLQPSSGATR